MNRVIVSCCVALSTAGVLAASVTDVAAGPKAAGPDRALVVTSVTPSRNQSMLPDLSDPGANNRITVRFTAYVDPEDLVGPESVLGRKCELVDGTFAPVAATASVFRNVLAIDPFSAAHPVLAQGRYTLTLKSSIRSLRGRPLNDGRADFTTTFTVGSGPFPPVLRGVSIAAGQAGVGRHRAIVASFDEPIDGESAAASIRLEDRSTEPATPIPAVVRLARRGFDVIVAPATRLGYPLGADVTLVIAGRGSATDPSAFVLKETGGAEFTREHGPRWTADPLVPSLFHSDLGDFDDFSGEFTLTFRTKAPARSARR